MTHTEISNDLAFDLFARWEEEKACGNDVSLEEICAAHPEVLPDIREIARRLASVADLYRLEVGGTNPSGGAPHPGGEPYPADWSEIGRGASSVVYRGHDPTFGTAVAYKVLH